ncbi:ABC transporter ATP-binding protein [Nocardioides aurantiacus]|uniref:ABC transporter ATP-binding protein n=1 Tax=Nocardioides aurantiacus TaxID=86796 RepID=UPI00403F2518
MSSVTATGVRMRFGRTEVLQGLDLRVEDGEVVAVLGPSGCGKTTLLRIVAGFLAPTAGEVRLGEAVVADGSAVVPPWRRRVGYVPQEGALFPHLDVRRNVLFGLPRRERTEHRLEEMLELAELPRDLAGAFPRELSGGQQQRVALARALAPRPRVVLLDEPFSSLDAALRASAGREVMAVLRHAGSTGLLVTHDQAEALSLADRVAVMDAGTIRQVARPQELYAAPSDARVGSLVGEATVLRGRLEGSVLRSVLGTTVLPSPPATAAGEVSFLVRPEQVRLVEDSATSGVVRDVVFHGPFAVVRVALADGTVVTVRVAPTAVPDRGTTVGLHLDGVAGVFA